MINACISFKSEMCISILNNVIKPQCHKKQYVQQFIDRTYDFFEQKKKTHTLQ